MHITYALETYITKYKYSYVSRKPIYQVTL